MIDLQKYLFTCLLATAMLIVGASPAFAASALSPLSLGAAAQFAVLGGTNVTCTAPGSVIGDVGVSPGAVPPFTNTGCVITGATPPATNVAAAAARTAFLSAYNSVPSIPCTHTLLSTITGPLTLAPGVYCTGAAALTGTGVLTLDGGGNANAVWIFKIGAALTGTNFSVVMTNGGQPCNVFWVSSGGVTMTTSAFSGNILAGGAAGSITFTGGTLAGRALANVAVTMTGTGASVIGCAALAGSSSGKSNECDGDNKDKDHGSDMRNPFGSNDKDDDKSDRKDGKR